jgi:DNA mismatch repair ATPase MutL
MHERAKLSLHAAHSSICVLQIPAVSLAEKSVRSQKVVCPHRLNCSTCWHHYMDRLLHFGLGLEHLQHAVCGMLSLPTVDRTGLAQTRQWNQSM